MKELGMVLLGCMVFAGFFAGVIYPDLEYKGYSAVQNCTGECYVCLLYTSDAADE